ncbi:MAG TPA: hypothetical protein O0X39_07420 [Methanocorpusculum sp.]|nr:hypothetical protein [Methanocorpusculum sp.]
MDEIAKTEARNYLSAAGFFMIAASFILSAILSIGANTLVEQDGFIHIALGTGLLIVAALLVILHKRDMIAILFLLIGFFILFCAFTSPGMWYTVLMGFMFLVTLVTLTGQDKKKWMLFLIPFLWFVNFIIYEIAGFNLYLRLVFSGILAVLCLYYAFCCACERWSLPGAKILTADAATDFKASGSVLGYSLFAIITGGYTLYYILGEATLPLETFVTAEQLCGILMVFTAILLFAVGKMRFTPVMFLLIGFTSIIAMYSSGVMFIGIGILFIIIGLFAMLRKESRILPGVMLIVYGCTAFFTAYSGGDMPVVSVILNAVPCLIAVYIAFAVYSQKKLPLF